MKLKEIQEIKISSIDEMSDEQIEAAIKEMGGE